MTGEWVERVVADLEVGDDVKGWGVVTLLGRGYTSQERRIYFVGGAFRDWPDDARVDIRRPAEVTVTAGAGGLRDWWVVVKDGGRTVTTVAQFHNKAHAEEYAARLRSSAHDRALALGKDTP